MRGGWATRERAFPEFRFCVLNADAAELTRRLKGGGGGAYPVLTTKWFRLFLFGRASHSPTLPACIINYTANHFQHCDEHVVAAPHGRTRF